MTTMNQEEVRKFRREDGKGDAQRVLIQMILDKSGSMSGRVNDVIGGFNSYIETLRKDSAADPEAEYFISLTLFDTSVVQKYARLPLAQVEPLNSKTYQAGGGTALLDAVAETITLANLNDLSKTIVVTMTDGEENSSRKFTYDEVTKLIAEKEREGIWTFVFMGENLDAARQAIPMAGAYARNTVAYRGNTNVAYAVMAGNTVTFAKSPLRMDVNFMSNKTGQDDGLDRFSTNATGLTGGLPKDTPVAAVTPPISTTTGDTQKGN